MQRVGIFAIDVGHSYDDPFSISVCEKMLEPNPGKWRASRGFYIIETSGGCPSCGASLLVGSKHMKIGFKCPVCESTYIDYKGVLDDIHFRKAKTFDVTVTDNPAVPWTGVAAFRDTNQSEDVLMNKKELKEKLLKAGLTEDAVEQRLESVTDTQLKEFGDIPFAEVLKEFSEPDSTGDALDLDEVVKEFTAVVETVVENKVKELLDGFEVTVKDLGELEVDMKEVGEIIALKEATEALAEDVAELKEMLGKLVEKDEKRLKEMLSDMPRAGKLRIRRFKAAAATEDEDEEDTEDEEMDEESKEFAAVIVGADGKAAKSMTEWLTQ